MYNTTCSLQFLFGNTFHNWDNISYTYHLQNNAKAAQHLCSYLGDLHKDDNQSYKINNYYLSYLLLLHIFDMLRDTS